MHFVHTFFVLNQERYVFHFVNVRNSRAWGRNYKIRPQVHSFDGGPLPPLSTLVDTDVIHVIKMDQAFPLHFCILQAIKNWTVGRPGNEAKAKVQVGIMIMMYHISFGCLLVHYTQATFNGVNSCEFMYTVNST